MRTDSPIYRGVLAATHIATGEPARRKAINSATDAIVDMAVATHALDIVARLAAEHMVALQLLETAETAVARAAAEAAVVEKRAQLTDALFTLGYLAPNDQESANGNAA